MSDIEFDFDEETLELIQGFLEEARDNLQSVQDVLQAWKVAEPSAESDFLDHINAVFRGVHSIKGAAGMFGFQSLGDYAHRFENLLDLVRKEGANSAQLDVDFFLEATDQLFILLESSCGAYLEKNPLFDQMNDEAKRLLTEIESRLTGEGCQKDSETVREDLVMDDRTVEHPSGQLVLNESQLDEGRDEQPPSSSPAQAIKSADKEKEKNKKTEETMRVDRGLVDRVFNLAGEMLVASNNLESFKKEIGSSSLAGGHEILAGIDHVAQLASQLQQGVLNMRMVSVKSVFQKIPRIARETAKKVNKLIDIKFSGEETEIDKIISEQLTDPLTHLIRNAVDHGIETPDARKAKGKNPTGTLHVAASFESGKVKIMIQDDGGGIDPDRIFLKAQERGLIGDRDRDSFSNGEIFDFLFHAGFSTAEKLSDISGRGVGLDVVRSNVVALGGSIQIDSQLGLGTSFALFLPLTTGIKETLITEAANERFAIPIEQIVETLRLQPKDFFGVGAQRAIKYRGEIIGVQDLSEVLELDQSDSDSRDATVLVFKNGDLKLGLRVDRIVSKQQVLLKPLPKSLLTNSLISAATYLSNGDAILILDPASYMGSQVSGRAA